MAGRIPQSFIDELMARVDIVEVIERRVPLKKAGRDYTACCPFHSEKTPSFTVSPSKQFYHCFGCGAHGTAIGFLMEYEHMEFVDAVEELARAVGLEVPREAGGRAASDRGEGLYDILAEADRFFRHQLRQPAGRAAVDYLRKRGLTGEVARDFGIGYAPDDWQLLTRTLGTSEARRRLLVTAGLSVRKDDGGLYDRFRHRITFPIRDRRGRVIAFGGRILGDGKPKYLNSPETPLFHKGRALYGLYEARQANRRLDRLLVVEGYMDVVALAQFGLRNAVATLGTATTAQHLEQLFRLVPTVVFCFDGDRAGREAAWRALENMLPIMQEGREVRFLFLPEGEDPDTWVRQRGAAAFEVEIETARPFSDFFLETLSARVDTETVDGRARLAREAAPLLGRMPDGVFRDLMLERLAQRVGIDSGRLAARLQTPARAPRANPPPAPPRTSGRPVRRAIALLLHHPELAAGVDDPRRYEDEAIPGTALLVELLERLRAEPHIENIGRLLEGFRGRPEEPHLWRLAASPPDVPEAAVAEEFRGLLRLLLTQGRERRWQQLQHKLETTGELTAEEQAEWAALLQRKPADARPG